MKAMLYADWINLRQSLRTIVLLLAFSLVWTTLMESPIMFAVLQTMVSYLFSNTAFAVDQSSGWDALSLSLPVLRREVVASRFLLALAVNIGMLLCSLLCAAAYSLLPGSGLQFGAFAAAVLGSEMAALILLGAHLAAAFRWGIQKAGYVLLGLFCLVMLIPVSLVALDALKIDIPRVSASVVQMVETGDTKVIPAELAGIAAALVVYAVCYLISVRVYQRREI